MAEGRFYWLKLHRDFFKRHDIKVVEAMPNGKDYILFYLKLLVESVDHEGSLRFSDSIPYSAEMLSAVTNTNVDVVRGAIKTFSELGMVTILPDSTIYMEEVNRMIGSAVDNEAANRKRRQRERERLAQTQTPLIECDTSVTNCHESKSKRESKSKNNIFTPPTLEEVQAYCKERGNTVDAKAFFDYYEAGHWRDSKNQPVKSWKQKVITWEKHETKPKKKEDGIMKQNYDIADLERRLLAK